MLFVAGGFSGQGYVYDALTGESVATYQFGTPDESIVNDVAITDPAATVGPHERIEGRWILLRAGKTQRHLVVFEGAEQSSRTGRL